MDLFVILLVLVILSICWFILHYYAKPIVPISDRKRRHLWKTNISDFDKNVLLFCNVCENLLSSNFSFFCEYCSVACDKVECTKIADKSIRCKQQRDRNNSSGEQKHQYLKGNLFDTACTICSLEIKEVHDVGIHGIKCIWCHKSFHDSCAKPDLTCDFGHLKSVVIPPFCVKANRTKKAPNLHLTEITPVPWDDWQPLIVIYNEASGSTEIHEIATIFRRLLNPIQVISLTSRGPAEALEIVNLCPVNCRLLVCGGDGSVAWCLNVIKDMNLDHKVTVAICPQGTGNDLSRVLNWGSEINGCDLETPYVLLDKILTAEPVLLDRWQMEVKYDHRTAMMRRLHHDKKLFMYNYCSIGVDALVTLNFHKARQSAFYVIKSKIINKLLYFIYGTQQVIIQDCEGLHDDVELTIDGIKQELPELQSVILLNIDSWGAGCKLIDMIKEQDKDFADSHSIEDELIEVFGVSSSFHIAQLQVGLTKPLKLGRAKEVKVSFGWYFFLFPLELPNVLLFVVDQT